MLILIKNGTHFIGRVPVKHVEPALDEENYFSNVKSQ